MDIVLRSLINGLNLFEEKISLKEICMMMALSMQEQSIRSPSLKLCRREMVKQVCIGGKTFHCQAGMAMSRANTLYIK